MVRTIATQINILVALSILCFLIRALADLNADGKMDKKEFSIAMHLIKKKLEGFELPKVLPASMKADPVPSMGSLGMMPAVSMGRCLTEEFNYSGIHNQCPCVFLAWRA